MNKIETKHDRFKRLAESRVNNAIKQLELIGNLSNLNNYEYTQDEVKKIIKVLKNSLDLIEKKFETDKNRFKF
jgi:hypothetical protein